MKAAKILILASFGSACSSANTEHQTIIAQQTEPATVVYRAAPPRPASPGLCSHRMDSLTVHEVRTDRNNLYIHVAHVGASPGELHDGIPAAVELLVNGCPVRAPRANGTVWRDSKSPSTLTVSLDEIPDGQVDVTVHAHGTESTFSVTKEGRSVSELPFDKRNDIKRRPAIPELGLPPVVALRVPVCPESTHQEDEVSL